MIGTYIHEDLARSCDAGSVGTLDGTVLQNTLWCQLALVLSQLGARAGVPALARESVVMCV